MISFTVRPFRMDDIATIADIYGEQVELGGGSYELQSPGVEEMRARFERIAAAGFPILVAERDDGNVIGYAYAGAFHTRPGWRFTVEDSVYVKAGCTGGGIGSALLGALIDACERDGRWRQMVAVIGDATENRGSVALHRRHGFEPIGTITKSGWKFERWMDTAYMQRSLGPGGKCPPEEEDISAAAH